MKLVSGMSGALVTLAVLAPSGPASAKVRPVVEAGVHVSTVDYEQELSFWSNGWRPSFTGGAYVELPMGETLRLSPGLRYVQKGNRVQVEFAGTVGEFRLLQDYVAVPVLLQIRPFASRRIGFSVGPEVAFLVSAHSASEISGFGVIGGSTSYNNVRGEMDDLDFAIEAGVEYAFPLENHEGFLRLRYSEGLMGVADASQWVSDWSTRGVATVLGLRW